MTPLELPWVEITVAVPLLGALAVALRPDPRWAYRVCLVTTTLALLASLLAWAAFAQAGHSHSEPLAQWLGLRIFQLDELSAPLLPLVALVNLLITMATARTKRSRVAFGGLLLSESIRLATFACLSSWPLIVLLTLGTIPPWVELRSRGKPIRVYTLHLGLFVALLFAGQIAIDSQAPVAASILWMLAVLVRSGTIPTHCWVVDLFEHASFAAALLMVMPLTGVYLAMRLVLPIAPHGVLESITVVSLLTALYTACMALVQREARRFFAYLFLSFSSLVLVGLELHTPIALTGGLCLWISVPLSLAGLGLTLRALEARYGRLSLVDYHGLYDHSPALAVCFLLMGLASVGFPGTLGFIATELLVDGAVNDHLAHGIGIILTSALNGIAIVRVYFLLFTGSRHHATIPLGITLRERVAVLTLTVLILGGGIVPQLGVQSRHHAAIAILKQRQQRNLADAPLPPEGDDHGLPQH